MNRHTRALLQKSSETIKRALAHAVTRLKEEYQRAGNALPDEKPPYFLTPALEELASTEYPFLPVNCVSPASPLRWSTLEEFRRDMLEGRLQFLNVTSRISAERRQVGTAATNRQSNGVQNTSNCVHSSSLHSYNPVLVPSLIQSVASAARIADTLGMAKALARRLEHSSGDALPVLHNWQMEELSRIVQSPSDDEQACGIASRLKLSTATSRQRLRGVTSQLQDVQAHEVRDHRVVTLTLPTLSHHVAHGALLRRSLDDSLQCVLSKKSDKSDGTLVCHLHFVLYRERVPLRQVLTSLHDVCSTVAQVTSVSVDLPLEDEFVSVQLCSVSVRVPLEIDSTRETEESPSALKIAELMYDKLAAINVQSLPFNVQLLEWNRIPCSSSGIQSRRMYTALVRSIRDRSGAVERVLQKAFQVFPNFFPPRSFGPPGCPFRSYHIAAALEAGLLREALAMTFCVAAWSPLTQLDHRIPTWSRDLVEVLRSEEDRSVFLKQWFQVNVPMAFQDFVRQGRHHLLWNVVASCRVHALNGSVCSAPLEDDFVFPTQPSSTDCCNLCAPDPLFSAGLSNASPATAKAFSSACPFCAGVRLATSVSDTSADSLMAIALPLYEGNTYMADVAQQLGFPKRSKGDGPQPYAAGEGVHFRFLMARAAGFPFTPRPWVKSFSEPVLTDGVGSERALPEDFTLTLSTDLQMASSSRRNFTQKSRGQRVKPVPFSKYGYSITDRLPSGLLASAALRQSRDRFLKCVAIHCTLPCTTELKMMFREALLVQQELPPLSLLHLSDQEAKTESDRIPQAVSPNAVEGKERSKKSDNLPAYEDGNILSIPSRELKRKYRSAHK